MTIFPTPFTVGWHTYTPPVEDANGGIVTDGFHTPPLKDEDGNPVLGTPRKVIYIAPGGSSEPNEVRVEHDIDLGVPPDFTATPQDVVDLDGERFDVVGYPDDYTRSPWGFRPGKVVKLRRTQS